MDFQVCAPDMSPRTRAICAPEIRARRTCTAPGLPFSARTEFLTSYKRRRTLSGVCSPTGSALGAPPRAVPLVRSARRWRSERTRLPRCCSGRTQSRLGGLRNACGARSSTSRCLSRAPFRALRKASRLVPGYRTVTRSAARRFGTLDKSDAIGHPSRSTSPRTKGRQQR